MTTRPRRWGGPADRLFAARYDAMLAEDERAWLGPLRRRLLSDLSGDVLEIGPGTGVNRDHYPAHLDRLVLLEPSPYMRERLRSAYAGHALEPDIRGVGDEALADLPDASFDAVVTTLVLCSLPDPGATATQLRRVLRPGGRLVVIEHVRGAGLRGRIQHALSPLTARIAHGCRMDRDTAATLRAAGFDVSGLATVPDARRSIHAPYIAGSCVVTSPR